MAQRSDTTVARSMSRECGVVDRPVVDNHCRHIASSEHRVVAVGCAVADRCVG